MIDLNSDIRRYGLASKAELKVVEFEWGQEVNSGEIGEYYNK